MPAPNENVPNLSDLFNDIMVSKGIPVVQSVLFGLILIGIIIKAFTSNIRVELTEEQKNNGLLPIGPATGSIWGYCIILFATMGVIFISVNPQEENMEQIKNIPISVFMIVVLLIWSVMLNFNHYSQINGGNMPFEYTTWDNWSIVIISILAILSILEILINSKSPTYDNLKPNMKIIMVVVFISGIVTLTIQDTIVQYFLVDG